ncbi:MAG: YkvA family protein [Treponemataceae bacterium]|nr:MAG: YkvA family protein [Treponemataceae bacterium]
MANNFFGKIKAKKLKYNTAALSIAYKRKDVPFCAKIAIMITVGYALSPIDLIPDFIPVLGYLDDILIVPLLVILSVKLIPNEIFEECKKEAADLWENGKPKKWYYGIPILIIWLLVIFMVTKNLFFK